MTDLSNHPDPANAQPLADTAEMPSTRIDGWTPARKVCFLEALQEIGNVRVAAARAGMHHAGAYRLRHRDADFAALWDAALLMARDHAADILRERALEGIAEDVWFKGERVGTRIRHDGRLLLAHLARLDAMAERTPKARSTARRFDELLARIGQDTPTAAPAAFGRFGRPKTPAWEPRPADAQDRVASVGFDDSAGLS